MKPKILLVEDDESLGFVTMDNLEEEGYNVVWAKEGQSGLEFFGREEFDLCILDVMLPRQDGFSLAREIRGQNEFIPILFLTARSMEEDRLRGFEIGGDDYLTKPFSMKELVYRIRVFIRRTQQTKKENQTPVETLGIFSFNYDMLELRTGQDAIMMTQREADLLHLLVVNKNTIVKRSDILENLWGEDDYFKGRSLDVFISRLRKYLKADPSIEVRNHHGVGFCLKEFTA